MLAVANELLDRDPEPNTDEANRLELISLLIEDYENKEYTFSLPSPVDAIKIRMEEMSLRQKDLIPYIGPKSKVSEVLSGKRKLSLAMIRSLSKALDIPEKVLVQDYGTEMSEEGVNWNLFPLREMSKRGWINPINIKSLDEIENALESFFKPLGLSKMESIRYRMTKTVRTQERTDDYALIAWTTRIVSKAKSTTNVPEFKRSNLTVEFLRNLAKNSVHEKGPLIAKDILQAIGIVLVTERHLPHTYLDGVAIMRKTPIVGMTLRHDRLDNFWFTLMHELAHVHLHYDIQEEFYDDLDHSMPGEPLEWQADNLALNVLIPNEDWAASAASRLPTPTAVRVLAGQLGIHQAIVAGRVRREFGDYSLLTDLVGSGKVRNLFLGGD